MARIIVGNVPRYAESPPRRDFPPRWWRRLHRVQIHRPYRPSRPAATTKYTKVEMAKLKAKMNSDCMFCGVHLRNRDMTCGHLFYECKGLVLPKPLQDEVEAIRAGGRKIPLPVLPGVFKWDASPMEGLFDMTMSKFRKGTVCAPLTWLYRAMDEDMKKGIGGIRGANVAQKFQNVMTGEERTRFFGDKVAHEEWEGIVREKIRIGEITEVLIPILFRHWSANDLNRLAEEDHAALIVINIGDLKWKQVSFYDSQRDPKYFAKASDNLVKEFIEERILAGIERDADYVGEPWMLKEPVYNSMCCKGCTAVVLYWLHRRYIGKPIKDPNNTGTLNFFKGLMFAVAKKKEPHRLMRGEEFDGEWKYVSSEVANTADTDPELQEHIAELITAIRQANLGEK